MGTVFFGGGFHSLVSIPRWQTFKKASVSRYNEEPLDTIVCYYGSRGFSGCSQLGTVFFLLSVWFLYPAGKNSPKFLEIERAVPSNLGDWAGRGMAKIATAFVAEPPQRNFWLGIFT